MIRKLTPRDYKKSEWSGGTTTQLAIFPPEANYAERDFLWRVSSAAVELEESDFTLLPDYDRLISTLAGELLLRHNGGPVLRLRPFEVHAFSGADATHSRGRCTDFNLMLRRGKARGSMEALRLTEAEALPVRGLLRRKRCSYTAQKERPMWGRSLAARLKRLPPQGLALPVRFPVRWRPATPCWSQSLSPWRSAAPPS